jgi:hypothetical protein
MGRNILRSKSSKNLLDRDLTLQYSQAVVKTALDRAASNSTSFDAGRVETAVKLSCTTPSPGGMVVKTASGASGQHINGLIIRVFLHTECPVARTSVTCHHCDRPQHKQHEPSSKRHRRGLRQGRLSNRMARDISQIPGSGKIEFVAHADRARNSESARPINHLVFNRLLQDV